MMRPAAQTKPTLLKASHLSKRYGGIQALSNVNIEVLEGSITGLIGPNGAGKTTCFNVLTGFVKADEGTLSFHGQTIQNPSPDHMARMGLVRTFQNIRLFQGLNARENVAVGMHCKLRSGLFGAVFRTKKQLREEQHMRTECELLLSYVGLQDFGDYMATELPYGHQRRLEIARALASQPKLLALDEPAAGMNATEKQSLKLLLKKIAQDGTTVLVIEHDMGLMMNVCDEVYVFDQGKNIFVGEPNAVQNSPEVIAAYLGTRLKTA